MWEEEKRYLKGLGGNAEESFMEGWEIIANSLTKAARKMSEVLTIPNKYWNFNAIYTFRNLLSNGLHQDFFF